MHKKGSTSSCELPESRRTFHQQVNRHYRFQDTFQWKGVPVEKYKSTGDDWQGIARQTIIGSRGETTKFHLRYFEIAPEGYSSFEQHTHEHVVIGLRGKGSIRINKKNVDINPMDVVYIKPEQPHRLYNPFDEPFGFFCIVNARRDRPKPIKSGTKRQAGKGTKV